MKNTSKASRQLSRLSLVILFFLPLVFSFEYAQMRASGWLTLLSAIGFFGCCVLGMRSVKAYIFLIPLVVLFIPNAVNDLFPGVLITAATDVKQDSFSIFTHIDIYFLLGYLRYGSKGEMLGTRPSLLLALGVFAYALIFPIQLLGYGHVPVLAGICQLRYIALLMLISERLNIAEYGKSFVAGFMVAVAAVTLEAVIYTRVNHFHQLTSGNLAINGLGHFYSASALFLFYGSSLYRRGIVRFMGKFIVPALCIYGIFACGTRGALVAFMLTVFVMAAMSKRRVIIIPLATIAGIGVLYFLLTYSTLFGRLTDAVSTLVRVNFDTSQLSWSKDTTSIVTRVTIWGGTLKMIASNFLVGIGPGVWDSVKGFYGIPFLVLLDPHDDYLSIIVSYGVPLGVVFCVCAYFRPAWIGIVRMWANRNGLHGIPLACFAYIFSMMISSLSNANMVKHQLFMITVIVVASFYGGMKLVYRTENDSWRSVNRA